MKGRAFVWESTDENELSRADIHFALAILIKTTYYQNLKKFEV